MWSEFKNIKSGKKELREFGIVIAIALTVLATIALWRGRATYPYLYAAAVVFAASGIAVPKMLTPLQKAWMAFSVAMGFVMSRVILSVIFYAVMTPIGLIMKAMGRDIIDERIEKPKASYWHKRPEGLKAKESYEKQF